MNNQAKTNELTIAELKKELAEKTRQLKIEGALEKVRSRSLAMRQSNELQEVVKEVFDQLQQLGISFDFASIDLYREGSKDFDSYSCGWSGNQFFISSRYTPYFDHPIWNDIIEARERGTEFHEKTYTKEEMTSALQYAFEHTELKQQDDSVKAQMLQNAGYTIARAFGQNCAVNINNWSAKGISDSEKNILIRFAKAFEQPYLRFLDLQQAEEHAREAQIEAALERVRSRAMAMQKSEELREIIQVIFEQLCGLDFKIESANFAVEINETNDFRGWLAARGYQYASRIDVPYLDHPVFNRMLESREKGEAFYTLLLTKEEKDTFFDHYFKFAPIREERKRDIYDSKGWALSVVLMKTIVLSITNYVPLPYSDRQNKTFMRFGKAFEQVYTRFLDLQKAEAQAREAQIEAALERVRSRSMSMQKSEELREVIQVVLDQLCGLQFNIDSASFAVEVNESDDLRNWVAAPAQQYAARIDLPYIDHPIFRRFVEAKKNGEHLYTLTCTKEEKDRFFDHFFKYASVTAERKKVLYSSAGWAQSSVLMKTVALNIQNYSAIPYSDEQNQALVRFGKAFEQTYTRFLDLQKAEAQAREAQIEAALERVRAQMMAMHKSDELRHVIASVFKQLQTLGFDAPACALIIYNRDLSAEHWMTGFSQDIYPESYKIPYNDHPYFTSLLHAWQNHASFQEFIFEGELKVAYGEWLFEYSDFKYLPEEFKKEICSPEPTIISDTFMRYGMLEVISHQSLSEEKVLIVKRFAKVFEQTYTRYVDLQKAEAQAREAQIEAALERVRSRSMAMQKSEELREVIQVISDQLCGLDFKIESASFAVDINETNDWRGWLTAGGYQYASRIDVPYLDHPVFNRLVEAKEKGEAFYTLLLTKEEKDRFFDHYFQFAPSTEERKRYIYDSKGYAQSMVLMNTISLSILNYVPLPYSDQQNKTLVRFGKAFEQVYTRFLDLQRAEAQAREAQIEAALERVRSRSMGMQKSEELREVIQVIFDQLYGLHFNLDTATFVVEIDETNDLRNWVASPLAQYATRIDVPYIDHPVFNRLIEAKETGKNFISYLLNKEEKDRFFDHYFKFTAISEERKSYVYNSKSWAQSSVIMKNIVLSIGSYSGIPFTDEENKTFVRFGKAFEQTYTRFLDLQKAEAAAREAVKQASVDRVRAEIASMRTTNDLDRIIPLVWHELTILHIPFIRCGVFIVNEDAQLTQVYLSTPEGKAIATFQLPFNSDGFYKNMLEHWRKNQIFKDHWNAAAFSAWTHNLVAAGAIQPDERYSNEQPPENLYLHFVPFMQGMLYVGNTQPLSPDELGLIESLADAFATAYARYEDFSKLEAAKQQIETTLTELKSTQAQLIQKEKMASLGELTAGIAHEIQNPLNFVNNFSEVSTELVEELKGERSKVNGERDKELELEILNDLSQNLEKINHHGKRADAIVKGMLQHSRASAGKKEPTDISALADEYLRLSYHGLRAKDKDFNADFKTDFDQSIGKIEVVPQDIGRVLLNLYNNAFYAASLPAKRGLNETNKPTVWVTTKLSSSLSFGESRGEVIITVKDNGPGIPPNIVDKIFHPFFTTKPTGQGTGLGLSLSYDILKAHGGEIKVESKEGEGSEFIIQLPVA